MKVLNRSQLLAIVLVLVLFGTFLVTQVMKNPVLYTYQPWVQQFFTQYGEPVGLFNNAVPVYNGTLVLPFDSFLRTTGYLLYEGAFLGTIPMFQIGAVTVRIAYTLLIIMIVIAMTHRVQYALVTALIVFTSSFFVFRSHNLIPENIAILFSLLIIWGFEQYDRSRRIVFLLPVMLGVLGNAFYHPPTLLISGIIVISYTVKFLINERLRQIEFTYFTLLICALLLLPMFGELITVLQTTWNSFGDNAIWALYIDNINLLNPEIIPDLHVYIDMIGYPITIFALLGIIHIVTREFRRYIHLIIMLGLMALFMVDISPQIHLSPMRMQDYIYIPLILISGVYISLLFKRTGRLIRMMLISILITMSLTVMIKTPPFFQLSSGALQITEHANNLLSEQPDAIIEVERDASILTTLIQHPEQVCMISNPLFFAYQPPENASDLPDCDKSEFRITQDDRPLIGYQIRRQAGVYSLYERLPETSSN